MKERSRQPSEYDRRCFLLPPIVKEYLALGKALQLSTISDPMKAAIRDQQAEMLMHEMTLEDKAHLYEFGKWQQERIGEQNGFTRSPQVSRTS